MPGLRHQAGRRRDAGRGGEQHLGLPVFDTVRDAVAHRRHRQHDLRAGAVCRRFDSRGGDAGIELVVCITEGVPVNDMVQGQGGAGRLGTRLIGPNCPGIITPEECKIGIMPGFIHKKGCVGIVSRSGTLTYETVFQTTNNGLGQSTCVGIGGDPVRGMNFIDVIELFERDPQTEGIIMVGEIGGSDEEAAPSISAASSPSRWWPTSPASPRRRASAWAMPAPSIAGGKGTAADKYRALEAAGVRTVKSPAELGSAMAGAA
jgi:succinyl-CoA synthetase alpha subunit